MSAKSTKSSRKSTAQSTPPAELPSDDPAELEARGDALIEESERLHTEATRLYKAADKLKPEEPPAVDPRELEAKADTLMAQSAALYQQATRVMTGHESGDADNLFKQAESLRKGAQILYDAVLGQETVASADEDAVIGQAEALINHTDIRALYREQDAYLHKQAWALFGQLVLLGIIQPPAVDVPDGDEAKVTTDNLLMTLNDLETALERINQQAVDEYR